MSRNARLLGALLLLTLVLAACVPAVNQLTADRPLKKVVFMAGFKAQANLPFVAVYLAQEKGYFREQGLEVEIQHSAGGGEHLKLLGAGQIQFSTAQAQDVLKLTADPGVPLVAICLFGQRGDQAFVVRKDSGITSPKDWEGRVVGFKVFPSPDYLAILKAADVDRSKITEVSVGFDPRVLVEKQVEVLPVFLSNEPDLLEQMGVPVDVFHAADYGVPTLGVTYVVNRDLIEKDPDTARAFLRATMKGLADSYANPDEAVQTVLKYAPKENPAHQRYMLETEQRAAQSDLTRANGLGWMTEQQWQALDTMLVELGAVKQPVDVKTVFTDRFLTEIYREGVLQWP